MEQQDICSSILFNSTSKFKSSSLKRNFENTNTMLKIQSTSFKNRASMFKSKLKSKIFKENNNVSWFNQTKNGKAFKLRINNKNIATNDWSLNDITNQKANVKLEDFGAVVTRIYKIMDKSLCWLKVKSQSKKRIAKKKMLKKSKEDKISKHDMNVYNTQIEPEVDEETMENCEETADHLVFSLYDKSRANLLSAPSMASSFDMSKHKDQVFENLHSTPQSLCEQFSPIYPAYSTLFISPKSNSYSNSSSSLSSLSTPSSFYSSMKSLSPKVITRRRLSFGITSSPMSIAHRNDLTESIQADSEHIQISEPKIELNLFDYFQLETNNYDNNNNEQEIIKVNSSEQKFIDHIDYIKQNIKTAQLKPEVAKSKHKKLQKIFQTKLKKQLDEMRKWQVDIQNEFRMNANHVSIVRGDYQSPKYQTWFANSNCSKFSLQSCVLCSTTNQHFINH